MSTAKAGARGWEPKATVEKASVRPVYKVKHLKNAFLAGYESGGALVDGRSYEDAEIQWQKFATKRGLR